ncbi:hypothetical protein LCGC14_2384610, partial [marine sediment metagenome]
MATFARSVQDSFSFSDRLKILLLIEVTATPQDVFTFSEVLITPTPIVIVLADSFTFTDRMGGNIPITRVVSTGSGTFSDSLGRDGQDFNRQPQDTSTFSESLVRAIIGGASGTQILSATELLPISEQIVRRVIRDRSPQDSKTFVDKIFPVITNVRTVTVSGAAFADSMQRDGQDFGRELTDALTFSDNLELITTAPGTVNVKLQDLSGLVENFLTGDEFMRRMQDTGTFAEQIVRHKIAGTLFGEDLGFVENFQTFDTFVRRHSDAFTFTDQIRPLANKLRLLQDSSTFVDQNITSDHFTRLLQEEFNFAERGNRFLAEGGGDSTT